MMREPNSHRRGLNSPATSSNNKSSGFRLCNCLTHLILIALLLFVALSFAIYFDKDGAVARSLGLPAPTTAHECIMSYTYPNFKPIPFCSPTNSIGSKVVTETCRPDADGVASGESTTSNGDGTKADTQASSASTSAAPLGGDDPVNALGGSATAEGHVGFQLLSFREGYYDTARLDPSVAASEPFRDVPMLLVPGNAGSYYDSRGMSSAMALGNVRRNCALGKLLMSLPDNATEADVDRLFRQGTNDAAGDGDGSPMPRSSPLSYASPSVSILGVQPFAAGFIEMSLVHNGHVLMRAAQHVRDSVLFLRQSFLSHHREIATSEAGHEDQLMARRSELVRHALAKLSFDVCRHGAAQNVTMPTISFHQCQLLKQRLATSSVISRAMVRRLSVEVKRVKDRGLWIVGHSLGGTAARLGAILALAQDPQSVAGIVTLAGPNMYPPVIADFATRQLFATMRSYFNSFCDGEGVIRDDGSEGSMYGPCKVPATSGIKLSDTEILLSAPPHVDRGRGSALRKAVACIASRRVKILSLGVGAFDKQVFYPSTSIEEEVMHSFGKGGGVIAPVCPADMTTAPTFPIPSHRLDRSSEQLLQVGFTTTHHGINYCSQFFNVYAYGLAELARGTDMVRAFPTFGADLGNRKDPMADQSSSGGRKANSRPSASTPNTATERTDVAVPPLPQHLATSTHSREAVAMIAFNRVLDNAHDVWLTATAAEGEHIVTPSKVYAVPFRGNTNERDMDDHFSPYAESDARSSHKAGRYHPRMVRSVAVFELPSTMAEATAITLNVGVHPSFPANNVTSPLLARATWLVRVSADDKANHYKGEKALDSSAATTTFRPWWYTADFATSKLIHGTSPITQVAADGHPVLVAPFEELADAPRSGDASSQLRAVREWALHHHHENNDHTHILFGGMRSWRGVEKGPATTCTRQNPSGALAADSSCAVPFAPPISYFDAQPKSYLFVAMPTLPLPSATGSSEISCVEWQSETHPDEVNTLAPKVRACRGQHQSAGSATAAPHVSIIDLESSPWLWFASTFLIRFAVVVQYYQLLVAVFSGVFIFALAEVLLAAAEGAKVIASPRRVSAIQMAVLLLVGLDLLLAAFYGFDEVTPGVAKGNLPNPSAADDSPHETAASVLGRYWALAMSSPSQQGTRDQWWGIPSTPEELVARFMVQAVGAYAACVGAALFGGLGYLLSKGARRASKDPQLSASLKALLASHWFLLALWLALLVAMKAYFRHKDIPLTALLVVSGFACIRVLRLRRAAGAAVSPTLAHKGKMQADDDANDANGAVVAEVPATLARRAVVKPAAGTTAVEAKEGRDKKSTSTQPPPVPQVSTAQQPVLFPRYAMLLLLYLVFTMFFFTIRNDIMAALAAAGQEQLYEERGAAGAAVDKRLAFSKPKTPSASIEAIVKVLATGSSGHFSPRADIKPPASWEQRFVGWLLLLAFPVVLLLDSRALARASNPPPTVKPTPQSTTSILQWRLSKGLLLLTAFIGALGVCQEPLEASPRSILTMVPLVLLLLVCRQ